MVAFNGFIAASARQTVDLYYLSDALSAFALDEWPRHASVSGASPGAGFARARGRRGYRQPGNLARMFERDWYNRIHLVPNALKLGALVGNITKQIEVWNAHFTAHTLDSITATGATGLLLTGQPVPPLVYNALQSRLYTFQASLDGPPAIDASFAFDFATANDVTLLVTGSRVAVFGFRANWSDPVVERLEWLTDVIEAHDGTEQRRRMRAIPRRFFEFAYVTARHNARALDTLLHGWMGRGFSLPIWMDGEILESAVSVGATSISVTDAANKDYHAGGLVVLWESETRHEALTVMSIAGNVLTLQDTVTRAFPAGSRVYPARIARIVDTAQSERVTAGVITGRVLFEVEDTTAPGASDAGLTVYQSYPVQPRRPDWSKTFADSWTRKQMRLDYSAGAFVFDDEAPRVSVARQHRFVLASRADLSTFRAWLGARAGRCNPYWRPTFRDDIELTRDFASTATALHVRNMRFARLVGVDTLRRDFLITLNNGQTYYRRIISATDVSEDEELWTFDTALGVAVAVGDVREFQFLEFSRLEQDTVEIAWETNSVAAVELVTRAVTA